jgi:signal transduction histidine kinase
MADSADDQAPELARLRDRVAALEEAVRARDDFIAIAAHELRNPMQAILGTAELALDTAHKAAGCPPRLIRLLSRMHDLVENYIVRATRLLEITRIKANNLQLDPSRIDLSDLVRKSCGSYRPLARRSGTTLELLIDNGIVGELDRLAVEQILDNLLSNAIKFGAGKPVTVRLQANGREVYLKVRDQGIGMSSEQQQRIFGRFEQVVTEHRGGGFGVGLWVTARLISAMGGRMSVVSKPGEGSSFIMTLPLGPSDRMEHRND